MDYDRTRVPGSYDAARGLNATDRQRLTNFFDRHLSARAVSHVIDLGCGTGRYSGILAETFKAHIVGIDPSQKMLNRAARKHPAYGFTFIEGPAEALPIADACSDLIFMSMVDHHLSDPDEAARECQRALRPGGHVFIRNTVAEEIQSYPYLEFFPSIRAIIEQNLHTRKGQDARHAAAGFDLVTRRTDWHEIAPSWTDFAAKIALRADSFVARLDDDEFAEGLSAIEAHAKTAPKDETVGVNVDTVLYRRT